MGMDARDHLLRVGCLAAAIALHAALMGGLWVAPAGEPAAHGSNTLVLVELLPPPAVAPSDASPEPAPTPPRAMRTPPTTSPAPTPAPEPLADINPAAIDTPSIPVSEPLPERSTQTGTTTQPATASSETPTAAASGASTAQALAAWQAQLLTHLQRYRRYPRQAERLRQQGVSYVSFAVDRQGRISRMRIERASGHPLLDEETLATLRRADPVPPPPPEVTGNPVDVVVPVSFHLRGSTAASARR